MLNADILETCGLMIEDKIGKEWKHEVSLLGMSSRHVNFEIDGREYVLVLHEIKEGQCFAEYFEDKP